MAAAFAIRLTTSLAGGIQVSSRAMPFDVPRGRRKLSRYLGADEAEWDARFRRYLLSDPAERGTVWLRVRPDTLVAKELSYSV